MSTLLFIVQTLLSFLVTPASRGCEPMPLDPPVPTITSPIMMSPDLGREWIELGTSIPSKVMPISFHALENEYLMGSNNGIYRGAPLMPQVSWKKELEAEHEIIGIAPGKIGPYAISLWNGFFQYDPLYGSWVPMHTELEDKNVHAVLETSDRTIVIGTGSGIFRSTDHGKSWQKSLSSDGIDKLAEHNNILFACGNRGLFRSEDRGQSWTRHIVAVGRPFYVNHLGDRWITIVEGQELAGIQMPNMVLQSTDEGKTWETYPNELPGSMGRTYEIRQIGSYLFGNGDDGLYRSADKGRTWEPVLKFPSNSAGFFKLTLADDKIFILYIEGC